eukprot:SAG31_NODE_10171_length_1175_cov_1.207221_3_plen_86_part_01
MVCLVLHWHNDKSFLCRFCTASVIGIELSVTWQEPDTHAAALAALRSLPTPDDSISAFHMGIALVFLFAAAVSGISIARKCKRHQG